MEWVLPAVTGTLPAIRNSHRIEVHNNSEMIMFGGRGPAAFMDDIHSYNPSMID